MNFTHSTSNKANPTQRHRTLTTISFFSFSCVFLLFIFQKITFALTRRAVLSLFLILHSVRHPTTHGLNCPLGLSVMSTSTWLPHETACCWKRETVQSTRVRLADVNGVWHSFTHIWTIPQPRTTATNYGWALRIMSLGDLFPVVPGHLLCVHKSCTRIPLSVHNEPVQEGGHVCNVTSGSSPLVPKSCPDCLAPPTGALLQNLVPFVSHYNATLYVCMHSHVEIP